MSLPNPINVTYVSPLESDTFPFQYIVKDTDNIINIDSTHGEVHVILRNIRNSGMLQYQPLLSINDGGNNASVNNITIYPSEGDVINDNTSYVLTNDGANSIIQISDINQWVVSSSQSGGGGGANLNGLNITYVKGDGANTIENGQQLLDGYEEAKTKVVIDNPTINYGALEIVSEDGTYSYSEPLDTDLLEPYFSNGQLQTNSDFNIILENTYYSAFLEYDSFDDVYRIVVYDPFIEQGIYENVEIYNFYFLARRSTLVVAAGYYQTLTRLRVNADYVDIVSLTGNCDVFLLNTSSGRGLELETSNVYIRGINVGTKRIYIDDDHGNYTFENCIGGDESFSGYNLYGTFINCEGGDYSFGDGDSADGTFINCVAGNYSFGYNSYASGTFINCTSGEYSFGGVGGGFGDGEANGVFENCKAGAYSFGSNYASGTFRNCIGDYDCFASYGQANGTFYNCKGGAGSFGGDSTANGDFYNCKGNGNSFGRSEANGNFYDCVGSDSCFGWDGDASGYFYNCTAQNDSFGSQNASGYFYNCRGTEYCFGIAYDCNVDGIFENCIGNESCFGAYTEGQVNGTFKNCSAGDYSFGGGTGSIGGFVNGTFFNCKGGNNSFGGGRDNMQIDGIFKNCIGGSFSFGSGSNSDLSGQFYDCNGGDNSFSGLASGVFTNCVGGDSSFGQYLASGIFTNCVGNSSSFGSLQEASGKFINCVGGNSSFGYGAPPYITANLTGQLYYCVLTSGTFKTVSGSGRTYYCVDGNGNVNNQ
jgi:hypothetical protein